MVRTPLAEPGGIMPAPENCDGLNSGRMGLIHIPERIAHVERSAVRALGHDLADFNLFTGLKIGTQDGSDSLNSMAREIGTHDRCQIRRDHIHRVGVCQLRDDGGNAREGGTLFHALDKTVAKSLQQGSDLWGGDSELG